MPHHPWGEEILYIDTTYSPVSEGRLGIQPLLVLIIVLIVISNLGLGFPFEHLGQQ